ncbi:hypothetical protein [Paenibacillus sp. GYB003]
MRKLQNEVEFRIVDRQFEGEQKLQTVLLLWLKKQLDGEQK